MKRPIQATALMKVSALLLAFLTVLTGVKAQALAEWADDASAGEEILYCWAKPMGRSFGFEYDRLLVTSLRTIKGVADVECEYDNPDLLRATITQNESFSPGRTDQQLRNEVRLAVERHGFKVVHIGDTPKFPLYKRTWVWGAAVVLVGGAAAMLTGRHSGESDTGDHGHDMPHP